MKTGVTTFQASSVIDHHWPSCPNCEGALVEAFPGARWRLGEGGREFGYAKCEECGLIFSDPLPTEDELALFYSREFDYSKYSRRTLLKRIQGMDRWRRYRSALGSESSESKTLLDIGCGHGWFLYAAQRDGWDCTGIDLPSKATAYARERLNLRVIEEDFLSADLPNAHFDVITLWHALEHMRTPEAVLSKAASLLKPTGQLLVAVPNAKSRGLSVVGSGWIWLQQPFLHIWHFSPENLQDFFRRSGLADVQCDTREAWDANMFYDGFVFPKYWHKFMARWENKIDRNLRRLGRQKGSDGRFYFYLDETARIIVYAIEKALEGFVPGKLKGRGSELVAIAKKGKRSLGEEVER